MQPQVIAGTVARGLKSLSLHCIGHNVPIFSTFHGILMTPGAVPGLSPFCAGQFATVAANADANADETDRLHLKMKNAPSRNALK